MKKLNIAGGKQVFTKRPGTLLTDYDIAREEEAIAKTLAGVETLTKVTPSKPMSDKTNRQKKKKAPATRARTGRPSTGRPSTILSETLG
jgi:hypothetical protein